MSPGESRGTCGHAMAVFDSHTKCTRCREKGIGTDPCVEKKSCKICDGFTSGQKQLATPTCRVRKEHQTSKAGKASEYQSDLKSLDDQWSECFAHLEALFLAKTFQVPVEPVQTSSVVVSDEPFIPPEQQSFSQTSTTGATGQVMNAA